MGTRGVNRLSAALVGVALVSTAGCRGAPETRGEDAPRAAAEPALPDPPTGRASTSPREAAPPAPPSEAPDAPTDAQLLEPRPLPAPPWAETLAAGEPSASLTLALSDRQRARRALVDWFRAQGVSPPQRTGEPAYYRGVTLSLVIPADDLEVRIYEDYGRGPTFVVGAGGDGASRFAFDLSAWRVAPEVQAGEEAFVTQSLKWAQVRDGVLYVAHAHNTYAASSGGLTGYVTALSLPGGEVLWRSRPRVANAETFLVAGDAIIAGYGFTREDDALYVLDRATGAVVATVETKSKPEFFAVKDGTLSVRTYKHDETYEMKSQ